MRITDYYPGIDCNVDLTMAASHGFWSFSALVVFIYSFICFGHQLVLERQGRPDCNGIYHEDGFLGEVCRNLESFATSYLERSDDICNVCCNTTVVVCDFLIRFNHSLGMGERGALYESIEHFEYGVFMYNL